MEFCYFRYEISQREIVYDVFNLLDVVLDAITPAPQRVVFEVQYLEASM